MLPATQVLIQMQHTIMSVIINFCQLAGLVLSIISTWWIRWSDQQQVHQKQLKSDQTINDSTT